ncbi:uracil phosphoribosyltransferase [Rickettsiales bacterium LUAb2]
MNIENVYCLSSNPLVKHKITLLRDKTTSPKDFREILEELTFLIACEASKHLKTSNKTVKTPLSAYNGVKVKPSMIIPIIRAGIGMINPLLKLFPDCRLGFMGLSRDEATLSATEYYRNIPEVKLGETVFILDPMLATGGSLAYTVKYLNSKGVKDIIVLSILSTPVALQNIKQTYENVIIYTAEIDEKIDENGFIIPGLGDAGDRIFNTTK